MNAFYEHHKDSILFAMTSWLATFDAPLSRASPALPNPIRSWPSSKRASPPP